MKFIIFINFLLAVLASEVPSCVVTVVFTTHFTPTTLESTDVEYGSLTVVDKSTKPAYKLFVAQGQSCTNDASLIVCLAFRDAAGTDWLGGVFGGEKDTSINGDSPDPVQVGSIFCSDEKGLRAQIDHAGDEQVRASQQAFDEQIRAIQGVRSRDFSPSPAAPEEDVDNNNIQADWDLDSEDDIPNAEGPIFLTADDDSTAP